MKALSTLTACCVLALSAAASGPVSAPAKPRNYILFQGVHVLTLPHSADEDDVAPRLFVEGENDDMVLNEAVLRRDRALWNYGHGHTPTQSPIREVLPGSERGCSIPGVVKSGWEDVTSTEPIKGRDAQWRPANDEEQREALGLLVRRLLTMKALSTRRIAEVVSQATVRSVQLADDEGRTLVVESHVEWEGASLAAFLLTDPRDSGGFRINLDRLELGGASDSDSAAGTTLVAGSADLDDDGVDELFITTASYESASLSVYQRGGGTWHSMGHGAGSGC